MSDGAYRSFVRTDWICKDRDGENRRGELLACDKRRSLDADGKNNLCCRCMSAHNYLNPDVPADQSSVWAAEFPKGERRKAFLGRFRKDGNRRCARDGFGFACLQLHE